MRTTMTKPIVPQTSRGKFVYFIWNNLPRIVLVAMIALIVVLKGVITEESKIIAAKKASEVKAEKPPINTITLLLSPATITDRINLPGAIAPWTRLQLMAKIGGSIDEVLVTDGDHVKKGDILARIEDIDFKIALDRAKAAYNLAKDDFERNKEIYKKGVIPSATLDINSTKMQTTKADYDNAKLMLSRTVVTSPMDGVIRRLDAKVGLQLSVGDPIAEILEIDRVKAIIGIPESDVTAVRKLDTVNITIQALGDKEILAEKHFLSPAPETTARLYNLELKIDNPENEVLTGMFVRADIIKEQIENSISIPFYSVISRNNEKYVYIEQEGLAVKREVSLGIMENWMVEVKRGLSAGDKLIVEGHRDVEDGQRIKIIKTLSDIGEMTL
ncbi:MAG: membrane fusion protein (multidrug efflux system) [Desulforhopalus sp.]|jgi:membrane fusion protein (multidrug efflux system)